MHLGDSIKSAAAFIWLYIFKSLALAPYQNTRLTRILTTYN